ncbi:pyrimidine 5'-nucleotidase [Linderina pennispora]|uniref:Pyrimidine 5'-nucleotidase n=1 Tax=Linderina pennispora TaxID=61395 RepID=A0A1Y1WEU0_9FUNG|nr:pyrimidine 5'-nucleotidase [Linderina pennispora]ORX72050.1 pyrimidine 5'-nucleotidase [Linderina pennispora]
MVSFTYESVFFFDIDNCLYPPTVGIDLMMKERIYAFAREVGLDHADVAKTCGQYYRDYGLSVRGLIKHHHIDPRAFNEKVDGSLPLEEVIKCDPELRQMIQRVKARKWAFTNAGLEHAERVLKCLGVRDLFEGITYCDYSEHNFACKPERPAYEKAMQEAGARDPTKCFFVDDSAKNVAMAKEFGWTAVHVSPHAVDEPAGDYKIDRIHQLPSVLPQLFE